MSKPRYVSFWIPVTEDDLPDGIKSWNDVPGYQPNTGRDTDNGSLAWEININDGMIVTYRRPGTIPTPINFNLMLHAKPVDEGSYWVHDNKFNLMMEVEEDYVPDFFPEYHYGDYVILNVKNGFVTNWKSTPEDIERYIDENTGN